MPGDPEPFNFLYLFHFVLLISMHFQSLGVVFVICNVCSVVWACVCICGVCVCVGTRVCVCGWPTCSYLKEWVSWGFASMRYNSSAPTPTPCPTPTPTDTNSSVCRGHHMSRGAGSFFLFDLHSSGYPPTVLIILLCFVPSAMSHITHGHGVIVCIPALFFSSICLHFPSRRCMGPLWMRSMGNFR